MAMHGRPRHAHTFGNRLLAGLGHAAKWAGAAHTAWQVGKGLYTAAQTLAPLAAALL